MRKVKVLTLIGLLLTTFNFAYAEDKKVEVNVQDNPVVNMPLSARLSLNLQEELWEEVYPDTYFEIQRIEMLRVFSLDAYESEMDNLQDDLEDDVEDAIRHTLENYVRQSDWFIDTTDRLRDFGIKVSADFRRDEDPYGDRELEIDTGVEIIREDSNSRQRFLDAGISWRKIDNPAAYIKFGHNGDRDWLHHLRYEPFREHIELETYTSNWGTRFRYHFDDDALDFTVLDAPIDLPENIGVRFGALYDFDDDEYGAKFEVFGTFKSLNLGRLCFWRR